MEGSFEGHLRGMSASCNDYPFMGKNHSEQPLLNFTFVICFRWSVDPTTFSSQLTLSMGTGILCCASDPQDIHMLPRLCQHCLHKSLSDDAKARVHCPQRRNLLQSLAAQVYRASDNTTLSEHGNYVPWNGDHFISATTVAEVPPCKSGFALRSASIALSYASGVSMRLLCKIFLECKCSCLRTDREIIMTPTKLE